jgi:hypothetical protein
VTAHEEPRWRCPAGDPRGCHRRRGPDPEHPRAGLHGGLRHSSTCDTRSLCFTRDRVFPIKRPAVSPIGTPMSFRDRSPAGPVRFLTGRGRWLATSFTGRSAPTRPRSSRRSARRASSSVARLQGAFAAAREPWISGFDPSHPRRRPGGRRPHPDRGSQWGGCQEPVLWRPIMAGVRPYVGVDLWDASHSLIGEDDMPTPLNGEVSGG